MYFHVSCRAKMLYGISYSQCECENSSIQKPVDMRYTGNILEGMKVASGGHHTEKIIRKLQCPV